MNEDDTFNSLRREPFRQIMVKCFQRASLGADILSYCDDIIEEAGWTREELNEEVQSEMAKGNIRLSINRVLNSEAQKEFLLTGKI